MSFLAPYTNAMRLGQGFNSYTQEICIENAVLIEPARNSRKKPDRHSWSPSPSQSSLLQPSLAPRRLSEFKATLRPISSSVPAEPDVTPASADNLYRSPSSASAPPNNPRPSSSADVSGATLDPADLEAIERRHSLDLSATTVRTAELTPPHKNVVQIVTYSSRMVDNVSDIVQALNISSSASIKYGTIKGAGSASIVHENKVEESDLNYIVTVKVTNETSPVADQMIFNPIPLMENSKFTEVFGDCFISGFTEGGEFSAIVSIKVTDKSKISAVKAAAEAQIAVAATPGLSVGINNSISKTKTDIWDDTETTISVNWAGGGDLKRADEKWDLATVVDVASRFPHLVQTCAQRTSAVLTRYTSLRSFNEANAKNPADDKFKILDYDLCSLYTHDLFSVFLAYKNIWAELSEMLKHPAEYREREPGREVPDPIELTPKGLNEARLLARKGLTQVIEVTKELITNPDLADLDENGQPRPVPYIWPGEIRKRMPIRRHGLTIREQADLVRRDTNYSLLTGPEISKIGPWAHDSSFEFAPLIGDRLPTTQSHPWNFSSKRSDTVFCTLDYLKKPKRPSPLRKIRFFAHENLHLNWLKLFGLQTYSQRRHGRLSGIGFSTPNDPPATVKDGGIHHVVGKITRNPRFWSHPVADLTRVKAESVRVEYEPGSGCLAALAVLGADGQELTGWKGYETMPERLKSVEQEAPDERGGWVLAGFWGHGDGVVISSVGAVWWKA